MAIEGSPKDCACILENVYKDIDLLTLRLNELAEASPLEEDIARATVENAIDYITSTMRLMSIRCGLKYEYPQRYMPLVRKISDYISVSGIDIEEALAVLIELEGRIRQDICGTGHLK